MFFTYLFIRFLDMLSYVLAPTPVLFFPSEPFFPIPVPHHYLSDPHFRCFIPDIPERAF